ncbi:MAG TPA: hypothetical protein VG711_03785 [Phycisphaerales bacterium]|nr:hypothetical protein [Phycisphaerales bacterium]
MTEPLNIGVAGTGFIGRGLVHALMHCTDMRVAAILTRRPVNSMGDFPRRELVTNSVDELIEKSDLIVESTGDVIHATEIVERALGAGLPVVTMNAEFHVTTGSYFVNRGLLTEAHGDQPGALAALHEEATGFGFKPVVYGNRKGFFNADPGEEEMRKWSVKQGISMEQVTAATDGTKIHIEQALVANGLGADILVDGLAGPTCETLHEGGVMLAERAAKHGRAIADYVVAAKAPAGVFLTCTHEAVQAAALEYFKLGTGPYYTLVHNYHLCHLEIPKTIRRVRDAMLLHGKNAAQRGAVLLNNSAKPRIGVRAVAKREIKKGEKIARGIGSFDLRGQAFRMDGPAGRMKEEGFADHVPIGLISEAVMTRNVERGQVICETDVDLPESSALNAWRRIQVGIFSGGASAAGASRR